MRSKCHHDFAECCCWSFWYALSLVLSYYEIDGAAIRDLLDPAADISLADDNEQRTQVLGATKICFDNAELLFKQLEGASTARASAATGANDQSSRSHGELVTGHYSA